MYRLWAFSVSILLYLLLQYVSVTLDSFLLKDVFVFYIFI